MMLSWCFGTAHKHRAAALSKTEQERRTNSNIQCTPRRVKYAWSLKSTVPLPVQV